MKRSIIYDSKCHDLATTFLSDTPDIDNALSRRLLAGCIQEAVEDWFRRHEQPCDFCGEQLGKDVHKDCVYF